MTNKDNDKDKDKDKDQDQDQDQDQFQYLAAYFALGRTVAMKQRTRLAP